MLLQFLLPTATSEIVKVKDQITTEDKEQNLPPTDQKQSIEKGLYLLLPNGPELGGVVLPKVGNLIIFSMLIQNIEWQEFGS